MKRDYTLKAGMSTTIYTRGVKKGNTTTGSEQIQVKYLGVDKNHLKFDDYNSLFGFPSVSYSKSLGYVVFTTNERRLVQFKVKEIDEDRITLHPVWLGDEQYGNSE